MLPVRHSPAHDAPDPRLEEVSHLGLPEAVLVPVAPHVTDVVDDAASTTALLFRERGSGASWAGECLTGNTF